MKKITASLLSLVLMLSLSSCVLLTSKSDSKLEVKLDPEEITESSEAESLESREEKANSEIDELTVVDNDECLIKITSVENDAFWGPTVKVYLENKSDEKSYSFTVDNAAINGVELDSYFSTGVAPGKKANDEITFATDVLEKAGIKEVDDIELYFRVYDDEDWSADDIAQKKIHVYPYGENNVEVYARESKDSDTVLIDNEYVTLIVTGYETGDIWGYTANLYMVNKTDKNLMFSFDNSSMNGFMIDPFFAKTLSAEKSTFASATWSKDSMDDNNITEVEEIELTIRIYDDGNWDADDLVNETVILNP